eukprot:10825075-Karenia_brevis.AAC.1
MAPACSRTCHNTGVHCQHHEKGQRATHELLPWRTLLFEDCAAQPIDRLPRNAAGMQPSPRFHHTRELFLFLFIAAEGK